VVGVKWNVAAHRLKVRVAAWTRFRYKKLRLLLAWIGAFVLILKSHVSDDGFRMGIPFVIVGELIRLWATGYIDKKAKTLSVDGPYSRIRNPLYAGNFLIGLGIVIICQNLFFIPLYIAGFWLLYRGTMRNEEATLEERYGEDYVRYRSRVPRLIPLLSRLCPLSRERKDSYRWKLLRKNREYVTFVGIVVVLAALYLWEEVIIEREFMWKETVALGVVLALVIGLFFEWLMRSSSKRKG
jgi:protein-S-isoprenylcysteine O-methyltransferase Ste14